MRSRRLVRVGGVELRVALAESTASKVRSVSRQLMGLLGSREASAPAIAALFGRFVGTTSTSDFPSSFISVVRPWPSLSDPPGDQPDG